MKTETLNLDALRAPSRKITFLGREYEVGYIPSGAAIPLYQAYNRLLKKQTEAAGSPDLEAALRYAETNAREVSEDSIDFVAQYCAFFHPEVTREDVAVNASKDMVDVFFEEVVRCIVQNSKRAEGPASPSENSKKNTTGPSQ